jgi:acyl dehydratase
MFHPAALSFDRLEVGREWVSEPRVVHAADFGTYTALTADVYPAQGDTADGPDGACAPGLFGPAVATGLAREVPPVRTIAFLAIRGWQFLGPILAGDAVRVRNRVDAVTPRGVGRRAEVAWRVEVVNQRDDVVQAGTIVTLVEGPPGGRRARAPTTTSSREPVRGD